MSKSQIQNWTKVIQKAVWLTDEWRLKQFISEDGNWPIQASRSNLKAI